MKHYRHILSVTMILLTGLPAPAQISPGKLSAYHSESEGIANCTGCHELGQEPASGKCLLCHSALNNRIASGRGFHSSDSLKSAKCFNCHSEHNGREFELIYWQNGKENFDHALTGYILLGKHAKTACEKCHSSDFIADSTILKAENLDLNRTYLGLNQTCSTCHLDEHQNQLPGDCLNCHRYTGWKPASGFDHDRSNYPLTGKHRNLACEKCHYSASFEPPETSRIGYSIGKTEYSVYNNLPCANCTPCHQDPHLGKLGNDCHKCHDPAGFGKSPAASFNHALTAYPLQGMHANVACVNCHLSGKMTAPLKYDKCSDCHQDEHRGQFADNADRGACESCHSLNGFLPARFGIEEHQKTGYKLTGSHLALPCNLCHHRLPDADGAMYTIFDLEYQDCRDCHRDIHLGEAEKWMPENNCQSCHRTASWKTITFDHHRTNFPLEGRHSLTECSNCHLVSDSLRLSGIPANCSGCHSDIHFGQFAEKDTIPAVRCEKCHTSDAWKTTRFDHETGSRFPLTGAHAKVNCAKCHREFADENNNSYILYQPLSLECADCHGNADILKPKP